MVTDWLALGERLVIPRPQDNLDMQAEILTAETPKELLDRTLKVHPWGLTERDWFAWAVAVVLAQGNSKKRIAKMTWEITRELLGSGLLDRNEFNDSLEVLAVFSQGKGDRHEARRLARAHGKEASIQLSRKKEGTRYYSLVGFSLAMEAMMSQDIAMVAYHAARSAIAVAHARALDLSEPELEQVRSFLFSEVVPLILEAIA